MAALYSVKGWWYVRVIVHHVVEGKPTKKIARKALGTQDFSTATRLADDLSFRIRTEVMADSGPNRPITLNDAIKSFLESRSDKSRNTVTLYTNTCKKMIGDFSKPVFGFSPDRPFHSITSQDLSLYAMKRRNEGLKPASIALEQKLFIAIHNHLKQMDYLTNPSLTVKPTRPTPKTRVFTKEEFRDIVRVSNERDPRASDLFVFLMDTGCRYSEVLHSQWDDFDLPVGKFTVYRAKTNSRTTLILTPKCSAIVSKYVGNPTPFSGFSSVVRTLRKVINEVCNGTSKSNVIGRDGRATIHTCRHSFATYAIRRGNDLYRVSIVMGHTMATMTARYAHISTEDASRLLNSTILD